MRDTVVILANSVKHSEHCVAGKCLSNGRWVRPVGNQQGAALSLEQASSRNPFGKYPVKPLQQVEMTLGEEVPLIFQPENVLVSDQEWVQSFKISPENLQPLLDHPKSLWGRGNALSAEAVQTGRITVPASLYLVQIENAQSFYRADGKRRITFNYRGLAYDLPVTDPAFDALMRGEKDFYGYLCVSLGEEWHGKHYKIVAALI